MPTSSYVRSIVNKAAASHLKNLSLKLDGGIMKKNSFRTVSEDHVNQAMTQYLRGLSMIEDNEEVTVTQKNFGKFEIRVEQSKDTE